MTILTTREQRRQLERENANQSVDLELVPRSKWPATDFDTSRVMVWRSRDFLVQAFRAPSPVEYRLSVSRTCLDGVRWKDNISWDELQRIKNECGFADFDAVEVYPCVRDVVNVANMRHLWIMQSPLPFAWRKE